jgi:hypothetical protein
MPAETHTRYSAVDANTVLDLIWSLTSPSDGGTDPDPRLPLARLGIDDEAAMFWLWDAAAEEFADRTLAEPDFDELFAATTIGELAEAIVSSLTPRRTHWEVDRPRPQGSWR